MSAHSRCAKLLLMLLMVAVASADDELPVVDATSCDLANLPANWLSIVLPESDLTAEIAYLDSYPASEFIARLEAEMEWEEARRANGTGCPIRSSLSEPFNLPDGTRCRFSVYFCADGGDDGQRPADDDVPVVDATSCDLADLPANWLSTVLPQSAPTAEIAYLDSYPASEFIARLEAELEWEEAQKANGTGCRIDSSLSEPFNLPDGTRCRFSVYFCADGGDDGEAGGASSPTPTIPDFLLGLPRLSAASCDVADLPVGTVEEYEAVFRDSDLPEGATIANATYETEIGFCFEWRALPPDVSVDFFERRSNLFLLADGRSCCIEAVAYTLEGPAPVPSAASASRTAAAALAGLGLVLAVVF